MANPFDQFDDTGKVKALPNPFDQFDDSGAPKESPVYTQGYGMSEGAAA